MVLANHHTMRELRITTLGQPGCLVHFRDKEKGVYAIYSLIARQLCNWNKIVLSPQYNPNFDYTFDKVMAHTIMTDCSPIVLVSSISNGGLVKETFILNKDVCSKLFHTNSAKRRESCSMLHVLPLFDYYFTSITYSDILSCTRSPSVGEGAYPEEICA